MEYVAISRLKTLNGLAIAKMNCDRLSGHTYVNLEVLEELGISTLFKKKDHNKNKHDSKMSKLYNLKKKNKSKMKILIVIAQVKVYS